MEFKFNINEIFKHPVVAINNTLVPPGFTGDKRTLWDTQSKVSQVVNAMGEASATAQNLTKPITTAERLRNSDHRLYLLIDQAANGGKGAITGMLKTGEKGLYVFDREGQHYQVSPPCVLDFYVHESRQRTGLGKRLFQHMLEVEQTEPVKMAIDRPSEKFLGFLNKHYNLNTPVKQMNNFVVYDGFFQKSPEQNPIEVDTSSASRTPSKKQSANGLQYSSSPYGRYGAPRPPCSMGQIIHNDTSVVNNSLHEPAGVKSAPTTNVGNPVYSQNPPMNFTQSSPNMRYENVQYRPIENNNPSLPQTQANINANQITENTGQQQMYQNIQQLPSGYHENPAYARGDMSTHQYNLNLNQNAGNPYSNQNQMQSAIDHNIQRLNKQDHTVPYFPINQNEAVYQQVNPSATVVHRNNYSEQNLPQMNPVQHYANQDLSKAQMPQSIVSSPQVNISYSMPQVQNNASGNMLPNALNEIPSKNNVPEVMQQNPANENMRYAQQIPTQMVNVQSGIQQNAHQIENAGPIETKTGNQNYQLGTGTEQMYASMNTHAQENTQNIHQHNPSYHPNEQHVQTHLQTNLPITQITEPEMRRHYIPSHQPTANINQLPANVCEQPSFTYKSIDQNQIDNTEKNMTTPNQRPGTVHTDQQIDPRFATSYPQIGATNRQAYAAYSSQNIPNSTQQNQNIYGNQVNSVQENQNKISSERYLGNTQQTQNVYSNQGIENQDVQSPKTENAQNLIGYGQHGDHTALEEGKLIYGYPPQFGPQERQMKARSIVKISS